MSQTASRQWLGVHIPAGDAERLFDAEYFEHDDGNGHTRLGCDRYVMSINDVFETPLDTL